MNPDDEDDSFTPDATSAARSDYKVGPGKPPLATRFVKGKSGNPRGRRPRSDDDLSTLISATLLEKVRVHEGQKARSMPKIQALLSVILNAGLKGDTAAACKVLALACQHAKNAAKKRRPPKKESLENLSSEEKYALVTELAAEQGRVLNSMTDAELRALSKALPEANAEHAEAIDLVHDGKDPTSR